MISIKISPGLYRLFLLSTARTNPLVGGSDKLLITETAYQMVIHHACCLHHGIADDAAYELESPGLQGLAHGIGFWAAGRYLAELLPLV